MESRGTIVTCCPGENFSGRWVQQWTKLYAFLLQQGFSVIDWWDYTSNPYHTRNSMWEICRAIPGVDYVLWIDDDNLIYSEHFERLYMGLQRNPKAGAIFGWAWCEQDDYEPGAMLSCGQVSEDGNSQLMQPDEILGKFDLVEVGWSGFPAVLMRGSMLALMGESPFAPLIGPQFHHGYSGEDFAFCRRAIEKGAKLFVDPLCQIPHLKRRVIQPTKLLKTDQSLETKKLEECAA